MQNLDPDAAVREDHLTRLSCSIDGLDALRALCGGLGGKEPNATLHVVGAESLAGLLGSIANDMRSSLDALQNLAMQDYKVRRSAEVASQGT